MSNIRIFSKKAFKFDHPAKEEPSVTVQAVSFANVPEWVKESTMFKLALKDEAQPLEIIESRADELKAEKNADKPSKNNTKNTDKNPPDSGA